MDKNEAASLAEQILSNPLFAEIMQGLEANAVERMIAAPDDLSRHECQLRIQAVRAFRADCEGHLRSTRPVKGAPA